VFPFSTASRYFLDALDMTAPANARAVVAFGDSITDGTASTMNGDDRWSDVLARRLHAVYGNKIAVVNAASATISWWGWPSILRKSCFPAGHRPKTGSTATCCRYPASPP
jgi:hypothetical protein